MMRAIVEHAVNGTTVTTTIDGGHISSQLWDGGRALLKVADRRGGVVTRSWQAWRVYTIDIQEIPS